MGNYMFEEEIASILNEEDAQEQKLLNAEKEEDKTKLEFELIYDNEVVYKKTTYTKLKNIRSSLKAVIDGYGSLQSYAQYCDNMLLKFFHTRGISDNNKKTFKQSVKALMKIPAGDIVIEFYFDIKNNKFKMAFD